jgi:hypothetical protein
LALARAVVTAHNGWPRPWVEAGRLQASPDDHMRACAGRRPRLRPRRTAHARPAIIAKPLRPRPNDGGDLLFGYQFTRAAVRHRGEADFLTPLVLCRPP